MTIGTLLSYYEEFGLSGVLKTGVKKIENIRDKHPEAWQHIDDIMKNIDSPMAIMESQNKKEPYTIIVLTDIVSKGTRGEGVVAYFLRPTEDGSVMVSTYDMNSHDISKHIVGLKAVDKEKAENVSGVGVTDKALAISIMNTLSAKDSIADLKEKYKNYYYKQGDENPRGATTVFDRQYFINLFSV